MARKRAKTPVEENHLGAMDLFPLEGWRRGRDGFFGVDREG
jgi:hypothetical protein